MLCNFLNAIYGRDTRFAQVLNIIFSGLWVIGLSLGAVLQGIVGKTLDSSRNPTSHVYLMNGAGNKVYPTNQPDGFVAKLHMNVGLSSNFQYENITEINIW